MGGPRLHRIRSRDHRYRRSLTLRTYVLLTLALFSRRHPSKGTMVLEVDVAGTWTSVDEAKGATASGRNPCPTPPLQPSVDEAKGATASGRNPCPTPPLQRSLQGLHPGRFILSI